MVMSQKVTSAQSSDGLIVRIAEIEVYPEYLSEYLAYATEVDRLSVEREPGVICLFPMQDPVDSCQIRILEIYANDAVYQAHLKTDHFLTNTKQQKRQPIENQIKHIEQQ